MGKNRPTDPMLDLAVDFYGRDYYEARWRSLSWLSKMWYTFRGQNPGGRKGAPPLR
jgi:hypothetical protein